MPAMNAAFHLGASLTNAFPSNLNFAGFPRQADPTRDERAGCGVVIEGIPSLGTMSVGIIKNACLTAVWTKTAVNRL